MRLLALLPLFVLAACNKDGADVEDTDVEESDTEPPVRDIDASGLVIDPAAPNTFTATVPVGESSQVLALDQLLQHQLVTIEDVSYRIFSGRNGFVQGDRAFVFELKVGFPEDAEPGTHSCVGETGFSYLFSVWLVQPPENPGEAPRLQPLAAASTLGLTDAATQPCTLVLDKAAARRVTLTSSEVTLVTPGAQPQSFTITAIEGDFYLMPRPERDTDDTDAAE